MVQSSMETLIYAGHLTVIIYLQLYTVQITCRNKRDRDVVFCAMHMIGLIKIQVSSLVIIPCKKYIMSDKTPHGNQLFVLVTMGNVGVLVILCRRGQKVEFSMLC